MVLAVPAIAKTPCEQAEKRSSTEEGIARVSCTEGVILGSVLLFQESTSWPKPAKATQSNS